MKVLSAATGSSMSISWRSWLKRFMVTPVSVLTKNDIGALWAVSLRSRRMIQKQKNGHLPQNSLEEFKVKLFP